MKLSPSPVSRRLRGFTLIELMVVIIIIGILAGLLLPAIFAGLRRSREFVIQKNITDLAGSLESFKNEYGVYPLDFAIDVNSLADPVNDYVVYQNLISEFVQRLSQRQAYGNAGFTIFAPGQQLENPYFQVIDGSPQFRDPVNLSAAEGYVFWLSELSENAEYPLGYVPDATPGTWLIDPNRQAKSFYAFDSNKLTDLDADGWPEFVPGAGPPIPICYFDSRTYQQLAPTVPADMQAYLDVIEYQTGDSGPCYPYIDFQQTNKQMRFVFEEPDKFQLISAGMDGVFALPANPRTLHFSRNDDAQLTIHHRDNIVNFREGRLDNDFETN